MQRGEDGCLDALTVAGVTTSYRFPMSEDEFEWMNALIEKLTRRMVGGENASKLGGPMYQEDLICRVGDLDPTTAIAFRLPLDSPRFATFL